MVLIHTLVIKNKLLRDLKIFQREIYFIAQYSNREKEEVFDDCIKSTTKLKHMVPSSCENSSTFRLSSFFTLTIFKLEKNMFSFSSFLNSTL